jgi:hypothetical protein
MTQRQKLLFVVQLGIAIAVIMLVAGGLSRVNFSSGKPFNILAFLLDKLRPPDTGPATGVDGGGPSLDLLRPIFWGMLLLSLIYAIVSPRYRKQLIRTLITVLLLVFLLSTLSDRLQPRGELSGEEQPSGAAELEEAEIPEPPDYISDPPSWFLIAVNALLALLFLGAIWYFRRIFSAKPDAQTLLVQEAASALTDLEAGGDLKNVVLRCYARMSQVMQQSHSIKRHRGMTPREFEQHLAEAGFRDEHIQRLTRLFEGVRYGARPGGGRTDREAMDCLRAIVKTYGKTA